MTQLEAATFPQTWSAEILKSPPLIAPARQFLYPQLIPGEEDALARGALQLQVRPRTGGTYLLTCALGFRDPSMPTAIHACPNPDQLCAVAGGYAYLSDTSSPESCTLLSLKPVNGIHPIPSQNLLLFVGFHDLLAWGPEGELWQSARLSWEGVTLSHVEGQTLYGRGWNMLTDKEMPFEVDLQTGSHTGGAYQR